MVVPFHIIFLIISLLTSITVYFQHSVSPYLKSFPFFLLITGIVEVIALWLFNNSRNNMGLYNFYSVFEICFFLFVIKQVVINKKVKRILYHSIWIYALLSVLNILFIQKLNVWHSISYSLGCLLIVSFSIYYFFELFKLPKSTNLVKEPAFWICSGIIFFYTCTFPFFGLLNFLQTIPNVIVRNLNTIVILLNVILYSLFTIAFLCRIRIRKPPI